MDIFYEKTSSPHHLSARLKSALAGVTYLHSINYRKPTLPSETQLAAVQQDIGKIQGMLEQATFENNASRMLLYQGALQRQKDTLAQMNAALRGQVQPSFEGGVIARTFRQLLTAQDLVNKSQSEVCSGISSAIRAAVLAVESGLWGHAIYWLQDAIPHVKFCLENLPLVSPADTISTPPSPNTS